MKVKNIAVFIAVAGMSGCVAVPMNPAEFRQAVKTEGSYIDSLTVNRPFVDVTRTMKKMGEECLSFSLSTSKNGRAPGKPWAWGSSKFVKSSKHAELQFQIKLDKQLGTIPKDGMYYLVADVNSVGAAKTKVDIYYWDRARDVATAIRGWATGDMLGCPDPTQMF
jgi:hypothetical protein